MFKSFYTLATLYEVFCHKLVFQLDASFFRPKIFIPMSLMLIGVDKKIKSVFVGLFAAEDCFQYSARARGKTGQSETDYE